VSGGVRHTGAGRPLVELRFTSRRDGDLCVARSDDELSPRRAAIAPLPWTWLDQVHGADVVTVTRPGEHAGTPADAAVTDVPGATLAVHTADCAGVLFWSGADVADVADLADLADLPDPTGPTDPGGPGGGPVVIGAAHAGWRGLREGVLQATVAAMVELGATSIRWRLGPCISAQAYEFGAHDLESMRAQFGDRVVATTEDGAPALDLRAGVVAALEQTVARPWSDRPQDVPCTATDGEYYSWRARADRGRQAAVIRVVVP
jgi:copper oxidase (laccase) domain-containing protein